MMWWVMEEMESHGTLARSLPVKNAEAYVKPMAGGSPRSRKALLPILASKVLILESIVSV